MKEAKRYYMNEQGNLSEGEELGRIGVYLAADYERLFEQFNEARKLLEHVQRNARHWWQGAVDDWLEANK